MPIKNEEKGYFKKGQSGNPKGRPRKQFSDHIKDIKDKGYKAPTRGEYFEMVGLLLSMEEEDLKEFAKDKKRPYWIRLIVLDLNNKNSRQKMMSDYRDWLYGKATQESKSESTIKVEYSNMTDEDLLNEVERIKKELGDS